MNNRVFGSWMIVAAILVLSLASAPSAQGQDQRGDADVQKPDFISGFRAVVQGQNGLHLRKLPDKVIKPPRTPYGQPDFQGWWGLDGRQGVPYHSIEEGSDPESQTASEGANAAFVAGTFGSEIVDPPSGLIPYQPWAAAKRRQMLEDLYLPTKREHLPPTNRCVVGMPNANMGPLLGMGFQILQRPGEVVFLYLNQHRVIHMDGRPHIGENIKLYMGDSRGHWEGNTLVVDVTNIDDKTWFDSHATFHSTAMHLVERWTMVDKNTLYYEVTVEDPTVFTQPWKIAFTYDRHPEDELWEDGCWEGEVSVDSMVRAGTLQKAAGVTGIHQHSKEARDRWIEAAAKKGAKQASQAKEALPPSLR